MRRSLQLTETPTECRLGRALAYIAAASLVFVLYSSGSCAQAANEKTFSSPGDAVLALYRAVKSSDFVTLDAIFGSNARKILHSGDDVADKKLLANFVLNYDQMHRVVIEPDKTATLYVGAANWPMPIPLVENNSGAWYFNTEDGIKEVLYRRVAPIGAIRLHGHLASTHLIATRAGGRRQSGAGCLIPNAVIDCELYRPTPHVHREVAIPTYVVALIPNTDPQGGGDRDNP